MTAALQRGLKAALASLESDKPTPSVPPAKPTSTDTSALPLIAASSLKVPQVEPVGLVLPHPQRQGVLQDLYAHRDAVADAIDVLSDGGWAAGSRTERARLQRLSDKVHELENVLSTDFMPQHSEGQLISPQLLLMSRLFNVRGKKIPRDELVTFDLARSDTNFVTYKGPELRQSDGLVFMALLSMARDYRLGTQVTFEASAVCNYIWGYYHGQARSRLREIIYRLQHAVLRFPKFSVQLAMRFDYPERGPWSVMVDPMISQIFHNSRLVWMDFDCRRSLSDGLTSWLFGYIEAQTKLIPQPVQYLRELSGSDAQDDASFTAVLRRSMKTLTTKGVIDLWSIRSGVIRWQKT